MGEHKNNNTVTWAKVPTSSLNLGAQDVILTEKKTSSSEVTQMVSYMI